MSINQYELLFNLKVVRVIQSEDSLLLCMSLFCLLGKLEEKHLRTSPIEIKGKQQLHTPIDLSILNSFLESFYNNLL